MIIEINNENTILDDKRQLSQIKALCAAVKWIKDHGHSKYVVRSSTDKTVEENSAKNGDAITETIDNSSGSGDDKEENAKKPIKISAKQIGKLLKALKKINDSEYKKYLKKLGCTTTISTSKQSTQQTQNYKQNDGNLISSAPSESNASDQTKKAQESSIDSIIRSATKKEDEKK